MGNHPFAIEDFNKAISDFEQGTGENAYFYRGVSRLKSKELDGAEEDFNEALQYESDPENPGIYDGLGLVYYHR